MSMIWLLWLPVTLAAPKIFPLVDPGLFVISGVRTCGGGDGYCLLGLDCTLDEDFLPDNEAGQHCDGLKSAFTPSAHFVCCRATNKTAYKPPITLPSVITLANTEPMTARTTPLNVVENEIDQVLQKVAQSVSAVNKSPVTEATVFPQADEDDQTSELRESEEADEEEEEGGEEEDDDEEMVADSPIIELWQEMSGEDDDTDELNPEEVLGEKKIIKESINSSNTANTSPSMIQQTSGTEKSAIEIKSEENTITPDDILKVSVTEENVNSRDKDSENDNKEIQKENSITKNNKFQGSSDIAATQADAPTQVESNHTVSEHIQLSKETEENKNMMSVPKKEIMPQETKENTTTNSLFLGKIPLAGKNNVGNDTREKLSEFLEGSDTENKIDYMSPHTTPIPDIFEDEENMDESINTNGEKQSNNSEPTSPPNSVNNLNQENIKSTINEVLNISTPMSDDNNQMVTGNVLKENDSQVSNGLNVDDTKSPNENATKPDENQLASTPPMSPVNHTTNNIQPNVMQGQPGTTEPCTKVTGEKCTQEVKFVIKNQTLCFGSVYALDWVVTSASCALRIFRAGMLDVIIYPLTETSTGHVKTIIVHESYAENSGASGQGMEANNIGLVQLHTPMVEWSPCVPCLPEAGTEFTGVNCSAVTSQPLAPASIPPRLCGPKEDCKSARSESTSNTCEGPSRKMTDDLGFSYITLNCDILWEPRFYDPSSRGSGAPLFCGGGVLAGVETGAGVGLVVYTPLTPYLPWLLKNTRPGTPEQTFNVS